MKLGQDRPVQHPVTQDIPLPGNYPCLTMQLNVTRYASEGLTRWTLIVREPSDGVEVTRLFKAAAEDTEALRVELLRAIDQQLINMRYMQLGD